MSNAVGPTELIHSSRYPIETPGSRRSQVIADVRAGLDADGCAVLPGFLSDIGLETLLGEATSRAHLGFYPEVREANVYLNNGDPTLGPDHPANRFMPRTNGFVRSPTHEHVEGVNAVLDGDRSQVCTLELEPGDLQFFLGRFSLHRVAPNTGAHQKRLLLIMSFSERAGTVGSVQRIQSLYGKVTDVHRAAAAEPVRADSLFD